MHIFIGDTQCDTAADEPGRLLAPHSRINHQAERTTCWHAVSGRIIAVAVCMFGSLAYAAALRGEENCVDGRSELTLTLREDASIAADYRLSQATRSLRLDMPAGRSENLRLEPAQASISDDGMVALPSPSRSFRIVVFPDPPERRWAGAWPVAFTVEGRGTAVYLPYLLPLGCGDVRVLVRGGHRVAAVVDAAYHRIEQEYQVADPDGFVLLGDELSPDSTIQFPKALPAWLADAISESYQNAQEGLTSLLDTSRKDVPLLVDFSNEGAGDTPRNGGDAVRGHCAMRLWFRGEAWQNHREDLRMRMNDVLVHELVHCYQEPEIWQRWAHEGHGRFVEIFLGARPRGKYSPDNQAEWRFSRDFDGCMSDLRVGEGTIDAYACGAVAYWLRWLQTGRVNMLAKADAESQAETRTMAGRFLNRTATETDVVDFVRAAGVNVQVVEGVREAPESVRSRLIITLLRQTCGHGSAVGYWTNDASITLDAPRCPELNGFELQAVAGRHIIEDVHLGYAEVAASCRDEGRVMIVRVGGDQKKWVKCDPSYEWPSTIGSRYRLVAPFDIGPSTHPVRL